MMEMEKKMPIGIENFEEIRTEGFYYVDKTGLIQELLHNWGKVNLFTRPRRFGKSLNMSMLKNFFEIGNKGEIFEGLKISEDTALCESYMGKFPVISVSLKGVSGNEFETARSLLCSIIGNEALRFYFLTESDRLNDKEKLLYHQLIAVDRTGKESFVMPDSVLMESLKNLSMLLCKHYGQKVIILIDEYDVPLDKAMQGGYYDQMISLIRAIFEQALKTNDSLYFAVLTGCLRVSKESIFTGLNNPKILSITDVEFDEYFGFMDWEVRELLEYYRLSEAYDTMKEWYDGYHFGNAEVYCPWDVVCYCNKLRSKPNAQPEAYWLNTSSNDVVRRFLECADTGVAKREIEGLVAGEVIQKEIHQELVYKDLYSSIENMWSVLFMTGYLTQQGEPDGDVFSLRIPNFEIRKIFVQQIMELFKDTVQKDGQTLRVFCEALKNGDATVVEEQFHRYLKKTISIRDTFVKKTIKENFYHGILLGLLGFKADWGVFSNKEAGEGYGDILVEIDDEAIGIVIEIKYDDSARLEISCMEALDQIRKKKYEEQFREMGMKHILKYGITCYQKQCKVAVEKESCQYRE